MTLDSRKMEVPRSPFEDEAELNSDVSSVEYERKSDGCTSPLNLPARDNANINVFCRFRPYERPKTGYEDEYELHFRNGGKEVGLRFSTSIGHPINGEAYRFSFDSCFKSKDNQETVYNACAKPMVQELLQGYNCTLFAYGQTGSGKTYTMMGDLNNNEKKGILPRLAEDLFLQVGKAAQHARKFTIKLSFIEIYMERIRDLLADDHCTDQPYSLKLRNDEDSGVFVDGVIEEEVAGAKALYRLLAKGNTNRAVGSTKMNAQSSRSHSVCMLTLCQRSDGEAMKVGKLFLVDLAGSEMVKKTGATLSTLNEAKQINKSLSALGNVIKALKEKASFVPYRDSKLTLLLKNSLGGDSKTSLIVTCAGGTKETLSTLRFGSRAKQIQNKPTVQKRFCDNSDCKKLRERLLVLEEENLELGVVDVLSALPNVEHSCQNEAEIESEELKKSMERNELLSGQLEEKEIELEALKAMLRRANVSQAQHLEIHQRDLNECLSENDKLKTKLAVAMSEIEELKGSSSQRESHAKLNAERLAEASKIAEMEDEIIILTQKYIHAKVELDELRENRPLADSEIVHIKTRNHVLEFELKGAKEKLAASVQRESTLGIRLLNRESKYKSNTCVSLRDLTCI